LFSEFVFNTLLLISTKYNKLV